ncbi:MAG: hypothetical protein Q9219_005497 [cf. Caloplaca sp. 3 TL-2023]
MTRPTTPPILAELRSSTSPTSQVAALRALKTELIGNEQKKRMWIGLGVLIPISRILNTSKGIGKRRDLSKSGPSYRPASTRTDEEEARLQAIIIVGSLAHGGAAYISPIRAGGVIVPILSILTTTETTVGTILAALRTLNAVADSATLLHSQTRDHHQQPLHTLYTDEILVGIVQLLSQDSTSYSVQQQISLAAALIAKTCKDEYQRNLLVHSGVLEALTYRLAAVVAGTDRSVCTSRRGPSGSPDTASLANQLHLAPILAAIGAVLDNSRQRAIHFLSTPALTAVLLRLEADIVLPHDRKATSWHQFPSTSASTRTSSLRRLEYLLPQTPCFPSKGIQPDTTSHPAFGSIGTSPRYPLSAKGLNSTQEVIHGQVSDPPQEEENALIIWLIYALRTTSGMPRLMAAWVIGLFHTSGLIDKRRNSSFAMLLVPLLVRLLDKNSVSASEPQLAYGASPLQSTNLTSQEQAPAILATMMVENIELQRAAVEAGAIKKLAQLLKESYNPLCADFTSSQWTAEPTLQDVFDGNDNDEWTSICTNSAAAYQVSKVRESVLLALASLASIRDDYRKMIIENGVIAFIIESLKPYHELPMSESNGGVTPDVDKLDMSSRRENPVGVILAACGATRSLSRSVTTLRTSLMDAGVAAPLFVLLKHHDVNVQVAATSVITNLVLEFSPMREAILQAGILKTLCDHARAMDPNLRLSSIWALKHLVLSAPKQLKRDCLGELGPGWLKQIVCDDSTDPALAFGIRSDKEANTGTPLAMGTPNAAGEQVDLLNATDGLSGGGHVANDHDKDDIRMTDRIGALSRANPELQQHDQRPHSGRASRGRNGANAVSQLQTDDFAVQKEGLDFIRNLICGDDSLEMIDYLFEELGQDKMFEILISKLRPRLVNAFNRDRQSFENSVRQTQPQTDIVVSVCYIVVHLAAGLPRHRQLLISQPELLKLILPLFAHPHHEVRSCCAWIVINLTWMDDQSDHPSCKERAQELMHLGWYEKLQKLESDPELDVRERTKTALHQINCAIR